MESEALGLRGHFGLVGVSMRKTLQLGSGNLELLGESDTVLQFRDHSSAVNFLKSFKSNTSLLTTLRSIASEHLLDVHRMSSDQILNHVGSLLVTGQIRILKSVHVPRSRGKDSSVEEPGQQAAAEPSQQQEKTSWIEIYLRDDNGEPVPGERYRIKLPDASVQEGNLDEFGHAEYYGINPGSCQVGFPELEDEDWELAP